jgi:CzcA family heavy metal efflux pump
MLQALVSWSVRQRAVVLVLAALLLLGGLYAARTARLDVFPEFAPPQVVIQTEAPGLSPLEVEQLVTGPVEQAVNGVPRLDALRSQSVQGLSVVTVIFQDGTDIYRARQLVTERLGEVAGQLPAGVQPPRLAPLTSSTGRLVTVGFTSDKLSPLALRDRVQYFVRPRLLAVPGVAQVTLFGGEVRQLQVQIDPDKLAARGLSLTDVADAARQATGVRGAGFVENDSQRLNLRVEAQVISAAELGERLLTPTEGAPVRLADVAHVTEAGEAKFGDAAIDGKPGVVLIAYKQIDGDTLDVTRRVEEELNRLRPLLEREGIRYHPALFRQASFIEVAIGNVVTSLLLGAALVAAVLFAFLFNLRTAAISLLAIPLSLLAAVVALRWLGVGLNTLTLGGLAIAVGEVVDDAIIDVENIFRRLRENAHAGHPRSSAAVVLSASLEVRGAVVYATFIVALVFVPVFFLSGLQGRLFAPLGLAYVLAVLASLLVAVTVTPALSLLLLPRASGAEEPPPLRWLQGGYDRLLRALDRNFPLLAVLTLALLGAAGWALAGFGGELLPKLRESHYVVHMRMVPGTSLAQSLETGRQVAADLKKEPAVRSVAQQAGRAELGEDTFGVEYSELEVDLERLDAEGAERVERALNESLKERAGASFEVLSFLSERIKETVSGTPSALAVKLYGDDLAALDRAASDVAKTLAGVKGAVNVRVEPQTGAPEVVIRPRPSAGRRGVKAGQVLEATHAAFQGAEVAQVYDRNRVVPVVVKLPPRLRRDPQAVGDLWLSSAGRPASDADVSVGPPTPPGRLRLREVAEVFLSDGRFLVAHEGGLRRQVVTCNVQGRDVASFAAEAERRLARLRLPDGVSMRVTGEHVASRQAQRELIGLALAAFVGIVLLLWLALGTARRLLLALVNLLFALPGGVAAVYLAGGVINVGSFIGFVTVFGITVRNGIMLASHWQHLHEVEGVPWGPELVFRGARERLAPVLMTALVTGLGLLPIAVGSGEAGREIEGPMAQVILGGLVTSTALNLLLLPLLYLRLGEAQPVQGQA